MILHRDPPLCDAPRDDIAATQHSMGILEPITKTFSKNDTKKKSIRKLVRFAIPPTPNREFR